MMNEIVKNQFWFYFESLDSFIELEGQPAFQISKVLRLKIGDKVILTNGKGQKGLYSLQKIEKQSVSLEKISQEGFPPPKEMTLAFALLKGEKTEMVIQKAVELSATKIIVFEADHSVSRLKENEKKAGRYKKIMSETLEQCMGVFLPEIYFCKSLKDALALLPKNSQAFTLAFGAAQTFKDYSLEQPALFIGPEGDFSKAEFDLLESYGAFKITLCSSLLKAETAAISAMAQIHLCRG